MSEKMELDKIAPAVENLACHQEQCDMDGVMVKVSRQALDEVLELINQLAISHASSPAQEPVTTEPIHEIAWLITYSDGSIDATADPDRASYNRDRLHVKVQPLRLAIPAPPQPGRDNDKHYLAAIRHHLKRLYSIYPNNARLREQISDEIDWIDAALIGESK